MQTIYKYQLKITNIQIIKLPLYSQALKIDVQNNIPYIWVIVDNEENETEEYRLFTFGTGEYLPEVPELAYIDSYQLNDGDLVFHIFTDTI